MHEEPSFFAEPRNWVLIAFVLFFVLFGRKLWSALAQMLDDRAAKVRTELDEAARLRREAEAMLRDAETRRAEALREAQALIEGAKAEAERVAAAAACGGRGVGAPARADGAGPHRRGREGRGGRGPADGSRGRDGGGAAGDRRRAVGRGGFAADRPCDHPVAECAGRPPGGLTALVAGKDIRIS